MNISFTEGDFIEHIFVIMEGIKNIGNGDLNIHVTDKSGEFKKTHTILEVHNFVYIEGIGKGSVFEVKNGDKMTK